MVGFRLLRLVHLLRLVAMTFGGRRRRRLRGSIGGRRRRSRLWLLFRGRLRGSRCRRLRARSPGRAPAGPVPARTEPPQRGGWRLRRGGLVRIDHDRRRCRRRRTNDARCVRPRCRGLRLGKRPRGARGRGRRRRHGRAPPCMRRGRRNPRCRLCRAGVMRMRMVRNDGRRRSGDRCARDDRSRRSKFDSGCTAAAEQRLRASDRAAHVSATAQPLLPRVRVLLQALSQSAASAEDQGLYGGLRETQLVGDLAVRQSLPLAQQDGAPLFLRHFLEDVLQADELVRDSLLAGRHNLLQHLEVVRRLDLAAAPGRTPARKQTLCAILNSQADSSSGTIPRCKPRNAFMNVVWTASSASSREPSWWRQYPKIWPE